MTYLFHRKDKDGEFFYPVDCWNDTDALAHVECNPGTIKVTTPDGRVVWSLQ
jgi:hypothetical protein